MLRDEIIDWVLTSARYSFSRSGGPGGQNVNKVNTKVAAALVLDDAAPLSDSEMDRIREKLGTRINANNELFVQSQKGRTQLENRRLATDRLLHLIDTALQPARPRIPTKPSRKTQERRLQRKRETSEKKRRRTWRRDSDI